MSDIKTTILTLSRYNAWRRGDDTIEQPDPVSIGIAISDAINIMIHMEKKFSALTDERDELLNEIKDFRNYKRTKLLDILEPNWREQ